MAEQDVVNVAVGTYQGALAGWQLSASPPAVRVSYAFVAHQGPVRSIITGRTKAAKTTMVSTSSDESARVFDIDHQRGIGQLVKHSADILCSAFVPMGGSVDGEEPLRSHLLTGDASGRICLWRCSDWSCLLDDATAHSVSSTVSESSCRIEAVACHPSGRVAMTLASGGRLCLWDLARMRVLHSFELSARTKRRQSSSSAKPTTTYHAEDDDDEEALDEAEIAAQEEAAAAEADEEAQEDEHDDAGLAAKAKAKSKAARQHSRLAPRPRLLTPETLQYSDSGEHFLVTEPGAVTVFDGSTGMQLCRMVHRSRVHCASFVPESVGRHGTSESVGPSWRVLSGCEDGLVRLWEDTAGTVAAAAAIGGGWGASSSAASSDTSSTNAAKEPANAVEITEGGVRVIRQPLAVVKLECESVAGGGGSEVVKFGRIKRMIIAAGLKQPSEASSSSSSSAASSAATVSTSTSAEAAIAAAAAALESVSAPSKITADTRALPAELIGSGPLLIVTGSTGDVRVVSLAAVLALSGSAEAALDGDTSEAFAPAMGATDSSDAVSLTCPLLLRAANGYRSTCLGATAVISNAYRAAEPSPADVSTKSVAASRKPQQKQKQHGAASKSTASKSAASKSAASKSTASKSRSPRHTVATDAGTTSRGGAQAGTMNPNKKRGRRRATTAESDGRSSKAAMRGRRSPSSSSGGSRGGKSKQKTEVAAGGGSRGGGKPQGGKRVRFGN